MALYTPEYKPTGKEVAIIKTSQGTIRVELDGEGAPIHVGNFVELAQKGFYDNLDSEQVKAAEGNPFAGLGTGGPGYTIKEEFSTNPNNEHLDGTLAMARSQDPNSAGSQFYLCLGPQPFLDSGYTVFGQTVDGLDVISKLRVGDVIETIMIENAASRA